MKEMDILIRLFNTYRVNNTSWVCRKGTLWVHLLTQGFVEWARQKDWQDWEVQDSGGSECEEMQKEFPRRVGVVRPRCIWVAPGFLHCSKVKGTSWDYLQFSSPCPASLGNCFLVRVHLVCKFHKKHEFSPSLRGRSASCHHPSPQAQPPPPHPGWVVLGKESAEALLVGFLSAGVLWI